MKNFLLASSFLIGLSNLEATYYTKSNYEAYINMGIGGSNLAYESGKESTSFSKGESRNSFIKSPSPEPEPSSSSSTPTEQTVPETRPNVNTEPPPTLHNYNPGGAYPNRGLWDDSQLMKELEKEYYNPGGAYPDSGDQPSSSPGKF